MDNWFLYVIIFSAIGIGWWLGRRERTKTSEIGDPNYYQGLNYLLNEEPDRAVSTFIDNLEVNDDTLETHLALGGLLRRRGELEKAVFVHENILSQAQLSRSDMHGVQLELARDYLLAGLLDRAEELCVKLGQEPDTGEAGSVRRESLKITLQIYEQEKEWLQAIEVAKLLVTGEEAEHYEKAISHYHCELAEAQLEHNDLEGARESVREAIGHDVNNPRTSLVRGRLDVSEGHFDDAIAALTRIRDQDPVFVPESLETLEEVYRLDERPQAELRQYLESCLELTPSISIVLTLAKSIRDEMGDEAVAKFIAAHLKKNPTIRGLTQLIDLHIDNTRGIAKENLAILRSFAEALVADKPAYRCQSCGFDGKRMRWHCPVCRDWASIKPIFGLEGE
ncbi:MAG: lipopolysaccharide assembly protein LapB [Gammaproteobacteria bacterium]|jgi:lipopolysaccharide assembly protein B|nr:lipopolysaccharide assembly protein LapB [Gammaproteobacteria bacterium]MBT4493528.1 lipopolysaccharide assembly protein LapB [Gammaproteobacteria bacterium]MBT7370455.1 lipopolysaccharide assembly protein LapB [Gammaproteobacteria bacterium]